MAYNPYINSFNTSGDFETYIESSTPKTPNVAYLKDLDQCDRYDSYVWSLLRNYQTLH